MIIGVSGKIGSGKDIVGGIIQYLTAKTNVFITPKEFANFYKEYNKIPDSCKLKSSYKIKKYAYKLKQIVSILTSCTIEDLENQEFKNKMLGEEWSINRKFSSIPEDEKDISNQEAILYTRDIPTYRGILQKIGTEAMRNIIHENVWINALFSDYKEIFVDRGIGSIHDTHSMSKNLGFPNWVITDTRFPNEAKAIRDRDGMVIRVNRMWAEENDKTTFQQAIHPSETSLDDYEFDYTIDNNGTIEELIEKVREILVKEKII